MKAFLSDNRETLAVIAITVFLLGCGYLVYNVTEVHKVTLVSRRAAYSVPVEDYQPRQTGGWDETVPTDAYNRNSYTKARGSHRVYDGEDCTGTGEKRRCTSQYRSVTDYDTWVDYTVDRWQWKRTAVNEFTNPEDTLTCPNPDIKPQCEGYGCERARECQMSYAVSLKDSTGAWGCDVTLDQWQHMSGEYELTVRKYFDQPYCDLLNEVKP